MHPEIRRLVESPRLSLLGRILDASPLGVSVAVDAKIVYANEACARMWGYDEPSRMLDLPFFSLIAEELHPFVIDLWHSRAEGSTEPWTYRLLGAREDGSRFAYECTSLPVDTDTSKGTLAFFRRLADGDCDARRLSEHHDEVLAGLRGERRA
jgi:PAS domain S-box-containing protein